MEHGAGLFCRESLLAMAAAGENAVSGFRRSPIRFLFSISPSSPMTAAMSMMPIFPVAAG